MKSTKRLFSVCLSAIILSFGLISCEKTFDEGDDFIEGKWKDVAIMNTPGLDDVDYMQYIEFAPYNYTKSKRRVNYVTYKKDVTQVVPIWAVEKHGYYTLRLDTLILEDPMGRVDTNYMEYIRNDSMSYSDKKGVSHVYVRFKE